mgnify:CR=1 FL=1
MGIKNLTEAEEKEFYRLVGKMNGEEPDKEQDAKDYPKYRSLVYFVDLIGQICTMTWFNSDTDIEMWELGNIFFTEEAAEFAREKRKVEVELERYAREHNDTILSEEYYIVYNKNEKKLDYNIWYGCKLQGAVVFSSKQLVFDAIEAVGKDRILKYIFGVDCEGMK